MPLHIAKKTVGVLTFQLAHRKTSHGHNNLYCVKTVRVSISICIAKNRWCVGLALATIEKTVGHGHANLYGEANNRVWNMPICIDENRWVERSNVPVCITKKQSGDRPYLLAWWNISRHWTWPFANRKKKTEGGGHAHFPSDKNSCLWHCQLVSTFRARCLLGWACCFRYWNKQLDDGPCPPAWRKNQ